MAGRERVQEQREKREEPHDDGVSPEGATTESGRAKSATAAEVLDDIDAVLEENAEEFVKNYVQRGGE